MLPFGTTPVIKESCYIGICLSLHKCIHSYYIMSQNHQQFSEVVADLSPDRTCEKQVVQLGDLPPSCSSQACKHNSGTKKWECLLLVGVKPMKQLLILELEHIPF